MLIKLPDGNLISTTAIERIERYTEAIIDPSIPDNRTGHELEWGYDNRPKVDRPALRVVAGGRPIYEPYFDTEAERDAEMTQLEQAVRPTPTLVFPNLAVRLDSVQVVYFNWVQRTDVFSFQQTLKVTIQLANAEPYIVFVTEELRAQAEALAEAFGVQIPQRPKSASELAREMAE
ncbi:hypothetical protein LJY25_03405 [Hymenobacter sp. BT175]|uniref:hypothetical protein n=1 Tax=Hymenobacter translucens TaxID=2886507 RepID=UPI001D0E3DCB|nr:hypothetical protein [Hymenobacter translucens]MCC2545477.1 hypothetical protein [Hymenobacter translucens]